ncbi:MAG: lysoplasmalogenase, partial [Clostridia bacterium]|nr:lysoplasmalogenase [Clostridia bacterium]
RKQRNVKGLFVKSFVSVCFLLTCAFATISNPEYCYFGILVLVGGILGLMGDIYLDQKWMYEGDKDEYLKIGFTCFGLGHIFYIWALYKMVDLEPFHRIMPLIIGLAFVIFTVLTEKPTKQHYGKFKPYVCGYGLMLGYTTALSIRIFRLTGYKFALFFGLGCAFFAISDIILSQMYFGKNKNNSVTFTANIIAYYAAQFLIALSPAFIGIE